MRKKDRLLIHEILEMSRQLNKEINILLKKPSKQSEFDFEEKGELNDALPKHEFL